MLPKLGPYPYASPRLNTQASQSLITGLPRAPPPGSVPTARVSSLPPVPSLSVLRLGLCPSPADAKTEALLSRHVSEAQPDLASRKSQHAGPGSGDLPRSPPLTPSLTTRSRPDPGIRRGSGTLPKRVAHVTADVIGVLAGLSRTAPPAPMSPSWEARTGSPGGSDPRRGLGAMGGPGTRVARDPHRPPPPGRAPPPVPRP